MRLPLGRFIPRVVRIVKPDKSPIFSGKSRAVADRRGRTTKSRMGAPNKQSGRKLEPRKALDIRVGGHAQGPYTRIKMNNTPTQKGQRKAQPDGDHQAHVTLLQGPA